MKNILLKVKGEGVFTEDQLIIFAKPKDIPMLKNEGVYKGTRFGDGDKKAIKLTSTLPSNPFRIDPSLA